MMHYIHKSRLNGRVEYVSGELYEEAVNGVLTGVWSGVVGVVGVISVVGVVGVISVVGVVGVISVVGVVGVISVVGVIGGLIGSGRSLI
jgi:hypothetical protein